MTKITTTWHPSSNPNTIYNKLKWRLKRAPTHDELVAEVKAILRSASK